MIGLARDGFTAAAVRVALHAPHRTLDFRYELMTNANARKRDLTTVLSASVGHNAEADIKRTARFTLEEDGAIDYLTDRIKPYVRLWIPPGRVLRQWVFLLPFMLIEDISYDTEPGWVEFPMGVFLLSSPRRKASGTGTAVREIEAYDLSQILVDDKVTDRYTITSGENYVTGTNGVKDLLDSAGLTTQNLTATSSTLPADVDWPPGTPKLQIINDLLKAINYRTIWFDADGIAVAQPYVSAATAPSEYTYQDTEESVILPEVEQDLDLFAVPNKWTLTVSEPDRTALTYTYTNSNGASPTSTVSRGRTIVDYRQVDAADLTTLEGLAERLAFEASQVYETVRFSTALMPMHSHGDVFTLTYSELGISAKYSELAWEMDLRAGGRMSHDVRRIVSV